LYSRTSTRVEAALAKDIETLTIGPKWQGGDKTVACTVCRFALDSRLSRGRQYDYSGPFKVEVDAKTTKGASAPDVTIKAGEDEATLKLMVATGLQPRG